MKTSQTPIYIAALFLASFFLAGCERLRALDREVGRFISGEILGGPEEATDISDPSLAATTTPGLLGREQKELIEKWLEQNGYNRFGDPRDTFYASGTPLFDQSSGQMIERFEYILRRHPDIFSKI